MLPLLEYELPLLEVTGTPSASVNHQLLSQVLRRQVVISNVQEQAARRMASIYLQAAREARGRILSAFDRGLAGNRFSQALRGRVAGDLMREMRQITGALGGTVQAEFQSTFQALWQAEQATGTAIFAQAYPADALSSISVLRPASTTLDVANMQVLGQSLDRWGRRAERRLLDELGRELSVGSLQGDDMAAMVRRTARVFGVSSRAARDTARTAVQTVSSQANARIFEANQDLLRGVQYAATFDDHTCPVCAGLDGRIFWFGGRSPTFEGRPQIPVHMNCRCVYVPVSRSWRDIGINRNTISRGTRASMNGQVAGTTKFDSWLRSQPDSVADQILGHGRAKLWRDGKFKLRDFMQERTFRPVPLRDLEARLRAAGRGFPNPRAKPRAKAKITPQQRHTAATGEEIAKKVEDLARKQRALAARIARQIEDTTAEIRRLGRLPMSIEERLAVMKPLQARRARLFDRRSGIVRKVRARVHKLLAVDDPIELELRLSRARRIPVPGALAPRITRLARTASKVNTKARAAMQEGGDFFKSVVSRRALGATHKVDTYMGTDWEGLRVGKRSFALEESGRGGLHTVNMANSAPARTWVHELGHTIEFSNHRVRDAMREFLLARGRLDPRGLRKLSEITGSNFYKPWEVAWEDKFFNAYIGKDYGPKATEVLSMGIEHLFANPIAFLQQDRVMFELIVNALRGNL